MSKRILLLYFTSEQKAELMCCVGVFKALFRKFRTSVSFDYLGLDTSPTCRQKMKALLCEKISQNDACLLCTDRELSEKERDFLHDATELYSTMYQSMGISVFFPFERKECHVEEDFVSETILCKTDHIKKCVSLCTDYALAKKKTVFVCTDESRADEMMFEEFQRVSSKHRYLDTRHMSRSEIVWHSAKYISQPCVVFADKSIADIVLMHTIAPQSVPSGYTLHHCECGKIYTNIYTPFSFENCLSMKLTLLAFAALIENELKMKNAAFWLRQSISPVYCKTKEELAEKAILAINEPMRKRER
ncbi:MAG: hypothetical protein IJX50_05495 [Clostridia bacterium]|nr:hypothetical protein [Clostridia bacterium]